jgi:hypothetical protein
MATDALSMSIDRRISCLRAQRALEVVQQVLRAALALGEAVVAVEIDPCSVKRIRVPVPSGDSSTVASDTEMRRSPSCIA